MTHQNLGFSRWQRSTDWRFGSTLKYGSRSERGLTVAEPRPNENRKSDERNPEFQRYQELAKRLFLVPKEEADEKRAERDRERKRAE